MEDKLNLVEILKDCPKGTKLWSPMLGCCEFDGIRDDEYPIRVCYDEKTYELFDEGGKFLSGIDTAECVLFPSKDNRDWSTFKAPKPKWNPDTLQPFDKVLVWHPVDEAWDGDFFLHREGSTFYGIGGSSYVRIIPYNDETKHLLGTTDNAPEYYRL